MGLYIFNVLLFSASLSLKDSETVVEPFSIGHPERMATTVFSDDFSSGHISASKWQHAITGNGGGVSKGEEKKVGNVLKVDLL